MKKMYLSAVLVTAFCALFAQAPTFFIQSVGTTSGFTTDTFTVSLQNLTNDSTLTATFISDSGYVMQITTQSNHFVGIMTGLPYGTNHPVWIKVSNTAGYKDSVQTTLHTNNPENLNPVVNSVTPGLNFQKFVFTGELNGKDGPGEYYWLVRAPGDTASLWQSQIHTYEQNEYLPFYNQEDVSALPDSLYEVCLCAQNQYRAWQCSSPHGFEKASPTGIGEVSDVPRVVILPELVMVYSNKPVEIQVMDMSGQVLVSEKTVRFELNSNRLGKGNYIVRVHDTVRKFTF